jgi:hypothetical protein
MQVADYQDRLREAAEIAERAGAVEPANGDKARAGAGELTSA